MIRAILINIDNYKLVFKMLLIIIIKEIKIIILGKIVDTRQFFFYFYRHVLHSFQYIYIQVCPSVVTKNDLEILNQCQKEQR